MPSLARGQTSDCSNPILDVFTITAGRIVDVASLEFQIWDVTAESPVQVFPETPGDREAVNLDPCPTGARLGLGHYVATWSAPLDASIGDHEVRWFFRKTIGSAEQTFVEAFEVTPEVSAKAADTYCTVQDLRDEGVPSSGIAGKTDAQLLRLIDRASRLVDLYTGRWFSPRPMVLRLDGHGGTDLLIGPPIISISEVRLVAQDFATATDLPVELSDLRIYNRHLGGLLDPDDRENPKISWLEYDRRWERRPPPDTEIGSIFYPSRWPSGTQNVEVTGIFGYTDPDGSPMGKTPDAIRRAVTLIVIRRLLNPETSDDAYDARNAWRLNSLRTRDQTITWANMTTSALGSRGVGYFTGDPEIDTLIAAYVRPPALGAA